MLAENLIVIVLVAAFLVVALIGGALVKRYRIAGPNEAIIVTGAKGKEKRDATTGEVIRDLSGQRVVMGAGVFVMPLVKRAFSVDLSARRIPLSVRGAVSAQGVKLNLEGVAIVKVGGTEDAIRAAAQRFLDQQADIEVFTQETLSGALRSIVGALTVEQIIRDRAAFAARVAEESEASLTGQGLVLDTFQIQDITDDGSYLADLGRPEQARVQQQAAIAEAEAKRAAEQARIKAEEQIALANRELVLRQAEIQAQTDAAKAQAMAAGPLAEAERQQAVLEEQEKVAIRQAALTERELETRVKKPADAERYRVEQEAEAARNAAIAEAEAQRAAVIASAQANAEQVRLSGEAEAGAQVARAQAEAKQLTLSGEAEKARRTALAEAVAAEGRAQAESIAATGTAEAEALQRKAEAFASYNDAAVVEMLVSVLPKVAHEVAAPMGAIDKLTVVSTEGAGALPRQVTTNLVQTMELLKNVTGMDLQELMHRSLSTGAPQPAAQPPAQAETAAPPPA